MTDQIQSLRDDVAYLKTLASEGARGPLTHGGAVLLAVGIIYSVPGIVMWADMSGVISLPPWIRNWEYAYAVAVQAVVMGLFRLKGNNWASCGNRNRVFGVIWAGLGITTLLAALGIALTAWRVGSYVPWLGFGPVVLSIYAGAWFVCAALVRQGWMFGVAAISAACAVGLALSVTSPFYLLGYSAAIFLSLCVPGFFMMRQGAKAA
ncbi:MAG: hypothetical protein JWM33_2211 [Caulobacteraceae bacterium]|nr:hypothetical protein [Caulobacteraceae bacterium]